MKYHQFEVNRTPRPPDLATVWAWVAGFTDAEAALMYRSGTPIVQVSNCHLPTLRQLCAWFGGAIRPLRAGRKAIRPCYQWGISGPFARTYLQGVVPFLREKLPQAQLILSEPVGKIGQRLSPEVVERRRLLMLELARLKRIRSYPQDR